MHNAKIDAAFLDGTPLTTEWDYYPEDPWAVHVTFRYTLRDVPKDVPWQFSRDLLVAGLVSAEWVGDGDVAVRREDSVDGEDQVLLKLDVPLNGSAVFMFPVIDLSRFLAATILECPLGDELMPMPDIPVTAGA